MKKKLHLYLIFLVCFIKTTSFVAQINSREDKKLFFKADNAFDSGNYFEALKMYKSLYAIDSTNDELNYKLGVCYFQLKKYRYESKRHFEKTSSLSFPETNYYLGLLNHLSTNFPAAINYFHEYIKHSRDNNEHSAKEIEYLVEKCHVAALLVANPDKTIKIENLGATINTEYAEYAPLIPAEENFIVFTSRRKNLIYQNTDVMGDYFEDMYVSQKNGKDWLQPLMLDTSVNKTYHDAGTGLSADGEKLLSYHTSPDLIRGHIYESKLQDGKWTLPLFLQANVNSEEYIETSACYSPDGEMIFFSSNRPGGYGGKDLYAVKKAPNGNWAMPFNLGSTINTKYNEDAPFVHPSDNVLFFSSEGHKNMGGYDIFKSTYDEHGKFTSPENLNYPINGVDDDIFFVLSTDASTGYFSTMRPGGFGSYDIYSVFFPDNNIPLNVYNIHVKDEEGNIIKNVEIRLTDRSKKEIFGEYNSNKETGKIIVISKPEKLFRITIESNGYEPLILNSVLLDKETSLTFNLTKKRQK